MNYEVTDPDVVQKKVPPVVPLMGSYDRWASVNGFSTSADPLDDTDIFNTPDFTVYGLWFTDINTNGLGKNKFVIGTQLFTYLKPVVSSDIYNGKFVQVAEPPEVESTATVTLGGAEETLASKSLSSTFSTELTSRSTKTKSTKVDWTEIIPSYVLSDERFSAAFTNTKTGKSYTVARLDGGGNYLIQTFQKKTNDGKYISAAVIVSTQNGLFREATSVESSQKYKILSEKKALRKIAKYLGLDKNYFEDNPFSTQLAWDPARSTNAFQPFRLVKTLYGKFIVYHDGTVEPYSFIPTKPASKPLPTTGTNPLPITSISFVDRARR